MGTQRSTLDEALVADRAGVGFLAGVPADVERQVVGLGEGAVTVGTGIGPGSGVNAHVANETVVT